MSTLKKSISVLLVLVMIISLIAVSAAVTGAITYEDTKLYFDASTTGWNLGSKDKVGFYVFSTEHGEEIAWGGKKLNGTDEGDGIWSYDPAAKGMNIIPGEQYKIIFTGAGNQTYDLLFDTTCYGHVAYCRSDVIYENPVDSSKRTQAAFWRDMDETEYGPVLQISSIGNVVGTCPEAGKTPQTIFADFLTDNFNNAKIFVVEPGYKTEQQLIDDIGEGLGITKDDVQAVITESGKEIAWSYDDSVLPGETPAEDGFTVSGSIKSFLDTSEVTVKLTGTDNDFIGEAKGTDSYSIENVPAGKYEMTVSKVNHVARKYEIEVTDADVTANVKIHPRGDITGDGLTNAADCAQVLRSVRKLENLDEYQTACGDLNNTKTVDAGDAAKMLRHLRKIEPLY